MKRTNDRPSGTELGIIVAFGAVWFVVGLFCGVVVAPVVLRALT